MRMIFAILAIALLVGLVGCATNEHTDWPEPGPEPVVHNDTGISDVFEDPGDIEPPVIPSS